MYNDRLLKNLLNQLYEYSREVFGDSLKNITLYGSYARGDYDEESDIDIMIFVDLSPEELQKYRKKITYFCADLNVQNGVFISPKLQSVRLFDQWKDTLPFYRNVIKEGISLYG